MMHSIHRNLAERGITPPWRGARRRNLFVVNYHDWVTHSSVWPFFTQRDPERDQCRIVTDPAKGPANADRVFLLGFYDMDGPGMVEVIRERNPRAEVVFLDYGSPVDLRWAERVVVDVYAKKHWSRTPRHAVGPFSGHTTLMECWAQTDDETEMHRYTLPDDFNRKARMFPSFVTHPRVWGRLARTHGLSSDRYEDAYDYVLPHAFRSVDVHAAFLCKGTPWYSAMRQEAREAVRRVKEATVLSTPVQKKHFMRSLEQSRMCFSPFGYGEVCLRDYEAAAVGCLILKPDVSHVVTDPNIFVGEGHNQTYVPLRWDLADLQDKVTQYLEDQQERERIARNAFEALRGYVVSGQFAREWLYGSGQFASALGAYVGPEAALSVA